KMAVCVQVKLGSITYDDLTLNNAKATAALDHGIIRLEPVTAELYGGAETGTVVIDMRPTPMTYSVNAKLDKVDANKLLSSVSSLKQMLYGVLAANANTSFKAAAGQNIARTLNGNLGVNMRNATRAGLDLL